MDIEGAEQNALHGCRKTIEQHKPKLALSAYHLPEDLYRLIGIVRDIEPGYKFYLRNHRKQLHDTVLYGVCP